MKGFVVANKGLEDVSLREIQELIKTRGTIRGGVVEFSPSKMLDICKLCYSGQSFKKVMLLFDGFATSEDIGSTLKNIDEVLKKVDLSEWLTKDSSFKVECSREGNHDFSSNDLESECGGLILDKVKAKVALTNPDITFYIYINNKQGYLGIDFAGFDMSKRDYKIFVHPTSIKGNIAYALVRLSGYKPGETLLDPFCGAGTMPIEAALYTTRFPINYFSKDKFVFSKLLPFEKQDFGKYFEKIDKKIIIKKTNITGYDHMLRNVKAGQKNAKIAGINKQLTFSKIAIEWLDTKFKEGSGYRTVTNPPNMLDRRHMYLSFLIEFEFMFF